MTQEEAFEKAKAFSKELKESGFRNAILITTQKADETFLVSKANRYAYTNYILHIASEAQITSSQWIVISNHILTDLINKELDIKDDHLQS